MAEKEPGRPRKAKPNPGSSKKSYEPRQPTPTENAKDEHIAFLESAIAYHIEECRLVRAELVETRTSHAREIGSLRETHGGELAALRGELDRLNPEVSRLRERLANLRASAGVSATATGIGGAALGAAGQLPASFQVATTVGGFVAVLCGVLFLVVAARRSDSETA